jgi:ribosomal-protein-alanine N-acetyltransferase
MAKKYHLPTFTTERLTLKPLTASDFGAMRSLDTNPEVVRYLGHGNVRTEIETQKNLQKIFSDYQTHGLGLYGVWETESNTFIGRSGLIPWNFEGLLVWEVGYSFLPKYWDQGYATECASFLCDWFLHHTDLSFVVSFIHPENLHSIHVAQKVGMTVWKEGIVNEHHCLVFCLARVIN